MTTYPTSLPDLAAPPATSGEDTAMPTGVITEDLTLQVEVPVVSLQVGETICKNPKDTSTEVVWKVTGREESDGLVFTYRALDGVEDSLTFEDLGAFVWVDLGPVNK